MRLASDGSAWCWGWSNRGATSTKSENPITFIARAAAPKEPDVRGFAE